MLYWCHWDLEIHSRAGNLHACSLPLIPLPTQAHTSHVCSVLPILLQRYFDFIVYNSLVIYSKYFFFLLMYNPGQISQKNLLSHCYTQALFPFLKHIAEQLMYYFLCSREIFYFISIIFHSVLSCLKQSNNFVVTLTGDTD